MSEVSPITCDFEYREAERRINALASQMSKIALLELGPDKFEYLVRGILDETTDLVNEMKAYYERSRF